MFQLLIAIKELRIKLLLFAELMDRTLRMSSLLPAKAASSESKPNGHFQFEYYSLYRNMFIKCPTLSPWEC